MRSIKTLAWTTATCALFIAACSVVYPLSDYAGSSSVDAGGCGNYDEACCANKKCSGALICGTSDSVCKSCVKSMALGSDHGCVLKEDSSLWCWGAGENGALGVVNDNGQMPVTAAKARQVLLPSTTDGGSSSSSFKSVGPGAYHTCAVDADDQVWCWGNNDKSETGSANPPKTVPTPVRVTINNGQKAKKVAGGVFHSCAILDDDTLWCWGGNDSGQLGSPASSTPVTTPTQVSGAGFTVKDISLGSTHSCAVTLDGDVYCWGAETDCSPTGDCSGKLGAGTAAAPSAGSLVRVVDPTGSSFLSGAVQVGVGTNFSCALTEDGDLYCWGDARLGQMGDGTHGKAAAAHKLPTKVPLTGKVSQVAVGPDHICALAADGSIWCWGENSWGQVGNGNNDPQAPPLNPDGVPSPVNVSQLGTKGLIVGVGTNHSCVATSDKAIWCWGGNKESQLGYPKDPGLERNFSPLLADGVSGPCS